MSCFKPMIDISVWGPLFHLNHTSLCFIYTISLYIDYYIICHSCITYQKYKYGLMLFHLVLPLIFSPVQPAYITSYIAYPWFMTALGTYVVKVHKQSTSFQTWFKSIVLEGLTDLKPSGETAQFGAARKVLNVVSGLAFAQVFLNPLLPLDPHVLCQYPWYSTKSMYYSVLMGFKGYMLMNCSALCLAVIQLVSGIDTIQVFNRPFLATSLQDFWGRRWNVIVRNLFFKQVYHHPETVTGKNQFGRWRAFLLSALVHEVIMSLVNRQITLENFGFFMVQGLGVAIERSLLTRSPLLRHMVTFLFLSLAGKLFLLPFIRSPELSTVFSNAFFL
ncbi:unnamed protein product [Rhizopus stolonifer]